MNADTIHSAIERLRQVLGAAGPGALTDADLLRRWAAGRDQAAFETLVWRHGPAVLGVCRRLVRREQDAEDAFQATFLALARKASSIRSGEAVAAWLHRVACRAALQVRAAQGPTPALAADVLARTSESTPGPAEDAARRELQAAVVEEVGLLPERYRAVVVLCYLEGRTNEEAARELGRPLGTVNSRLARARERLRARLTRRGLALPAGGVVAALASGPTTVSAALVSSTVRAALLVAAGKAAAAGVSPAVVALTEGVLRAMWVSKLKAVAAVVLATTVLAGGGGAVSYRLRAEGGTSPKAATPARPAADEVQKLRLALEAREKELQDARERVRRLEVVELTLDPELRLHDLEARMNAAKVEVNYAEAQVRTEASPAQRQRLLREAARKRTEREVLARAIARLKARLDGVPKGSTGSWTSSGSSTGGSTPSAAEKARAARLQEARDEVDLLLVQLQVKEAHLSAAKVAADSAATRLNRATALHRNRTLDAEALDRVKAGSEAAQAELRIREAELREPMVRLAHAKRRLAALEPPAPKPVLKFAAPDEKRLRDLERKLDAIRKEVEELRRATRPPR